MKESEKPRAPENPGRFKVGDRVQVRDMPNMFYTRTQNYVRGVTGTIAASTYKDLIPEDEAFNYDGRLEQYYIVDSVRRISGKSTRSTTIRCKPNSRIIGSTPFATDRDRNRQRGRP